MHVLASRYAVFALWMMPLVAQAAAPPTSPLPVRVQAILTTHCASCHGDQAKPKGGFGYISDLPRLLSRGAIHPGQPERSPLYTRIHDGEMPPPGRNNTFTARDREVLREWILAGAPVGTPIGRKLTERDVYKIVQADREMLPARQRPYMRYLSVAHLSERTLYRHALAKLLNSLSWHPRLTVPTPLADGAVFRLDLRHYRWTARQWDRLVATYPYAHAESTDRTLLRADWFIATASRPPAYHDLLTLPSTDRVLERLLQVEVLQNIEDQSVLRAGFNDSGVARANRVLERHDAQNGAYWRSYDFSDNTTRQNIFEFPLGPSPGPAGFKHAGSEMIFHLPNGLQGYMIVDADGRRIDKAPGEIVSDPKRPDRLVENGLSCMGCHVTGILPKDDQIREHVRKNARAFASEIKDDILALYPPAKRFASVVKEDNTRFASALKQLGVPLGEPEPVITAVLRYEETVDRSRALEELDITHEALADRLARSPELSRILGPLLTKGGVQRQVFEEMFPRLVDAPSPALATTTTKALHTHRRAVKALAFAPDGRSFASADAGGTVRVQGITGEGGRDLNAHTDEVNALAFSADGSRLVSAGADRIVYLWDVKTGKLVHRLVGHTSPVRAVAFGRSNAWCVSVGADRTVRIWDLEKGRERRAFTGHTGTITAVTVSPDGKQILTGSTDRTARVWRVETGEEVVRHVHTGEVHAVAFSSEGKRLATGGTDKAVSIRERERGTIVKQYTNQPSTIHALAFSGDGRSVYLVTIGEVAALNRDGKVLVGSDREIHLETVTPLHSGGS
jgi:WD40 repeat protein/mono/diheme cytochrome c family protein